MGMKMARYMVPKEGEWIRPIPRGYKLACCDCGLVHRVDFVVTKNVNSTHCRILPKARAEFRVYRDTRATAAHRRERKKRGE